MRSCLTRCPTSDGEGVGGSDLLEGRWRFLKYDDGNLGSGGQSGPPETAQLLYEALTCQKQLHIIAGNGHVGHLDRNKDKVFALTADWALRTLL